MESATTPRIATPAVTELLDSVDDDTIARVITAVTSPLRRWAQMPPGGSLRLTWPLDLHAAGYTARQ